MKSNRQREKQKTVPGEVQEQSVQPIKMKLPTILESYRTGNRGEAFLEFIMSKHCLMHKIIGYKDIGIDYICEWLNNDVPSRILFGIQVKTSERNDIKLTSEGGNRRFNELEKFLIKPLPFRIKPETLAYWEGLEIPLYLFSIIKNNVNNFDCYYLRLTPILHKTNNDKLEEIKKSVFFKANEKSDFIDLVKKEKMSGGFVRDLFIDSVRCSYQNGNVSYRNPKDFGLDNWPKDKVIFPDVLAEKDTDYIKKVKDGLLLLEKIGLVRVDYNFENKIEMLRKQITEKKT